MRSRVREIIVFMLYISWQILMLCNSMTFGYDFNDILWSNIHSPLVQLNKQHFIQVYQTGSRHNDLNMAQQSTHAFNDCATSITGYSDSLCECGFNIMSGVSLINTVVFSCKNVSSNSPSYGFECDVRLNIPYHTRRSLPQIQQAATQSVSRQSNSLSNGYNILRSNLNGWHWKNDHTLCDITHLHRILNLLINHGHLYLKCHEIRKFLKNWHERHTSYLQCGQALEISSILERMNLVSCECAV